MKVLIACEYSGIVRDAFTAKGHEAMSCDLISTESYGPHYIGNVMDTINDGWDMMIAHPPCTYLSYQGGAHWNKPGRKEKREKAMEFFLELWNAQIERICIENPFGEPMQHIKQYQKIQPYFFGDPIRKRTLLFLRNLPPLIHTLEVRPEHYGFRKSGKTKGRKISFVDSIVTFDKSRKKERSRFFPGIAKAMADQWG